MFCGLATGAALLAAQNGMADVTLSNATVWVEDALPSGAQFGGDGGDAWTWVSTNPSPYSGALAHQSNVRAGEHQHYFYGATQTLAVAPGSVLFAAVYVDPNNVPKELMLQWNDGSSWEHRAYWGNAYLTYGADGTPSSRYIGPMPTPGQWTLLTLPASAVGLDGSTLAGMAFTEYGGRATWDYAGAASQLVTNTPIATNPPPSTGTNVTTSGNGGGSTNSTGTGSTGGSTNTTSNGGTNGTGSTGSTGSTGAYTNYTGSLSNSIPNLYALDYTMLQQPKVGDAMVRVLTPNLLELNICSSQPEGMATETNLNVITAGQFQNPGVGAFTVTVNGQTASLTGVGFKRRPLYAPYKEYGLLTLNSFYLELSQPVSANEVIQVQNPGGNLWPANTPLVTTNNPLQFNPAIHVNQEGYLPNYSKQGMVGFYLGNLGEMPVPVSAGFQVVDANSGAVVFQGTLQQRPDSGWEYTPAPYQQVYMADFTGLTTPGIYRLLVPGMGASLPFRIDAGVGMAFARAYALGLYHQRCGTNLGLPYTRFQHGDCHYEPAAVPSTAASFPFTWNCVAGYATTVNTENPTQKAPYLTSPSTSLFPFVNTGTIDTTGGHHDAGDYSKYTINSASLVHYLMFEVDSLPGVAGLDNLGTPESGDGISDVMQEAKWEADYLAKLQDADGGFYFLTYPQNREYENNVAPQNGDPQVVWPKTTSVTAAATAALAQCATSPLFKKTYPATAAAYAQKALLGWKLLTNAIAARGIQHDAQGRISASGAYQKITSYGDNFADADELVWAACQMFLLTGDQNIHTLLRTWFDPSDPATWRWGWWHMSESYGMAIRSYAFAVQTGRATASQLDATFLSKCQAQIAQAGNDVLGWTGQSAYGTAFQSATKAVNAAGWYFSADQAFDMMVAYQLNPDTNYIAALLNNMNYEGGCNPVNMSYVTGLGWKRQRDIVSQWHANAIEVMPPSGLPVGNIEVSFDNTLWDYGLELSNIVYPADSLASAPYPFYDRWGDSWNVDTEMVVLNSARGLGALAFLAAQTSLASQTWQAVPAQINVPSTITPVGSNVTVTLQAPGLDLTGARITWEARDQQPAFGQSFTFAPVNNGVQWVEAEAQFPDGRRVFASNTFSANSPNVVWVDDSVPAGGSAGADGGDSWNWVASNPTPHSGHYAMQSSLAAGEHQVFFSGAVATLQVGVGSTLYAWVYMDPANPPSELMLQWDDGTWDHRAYWGGNYLSSGQDGTASRIHVGPLPIAGQWVQLQVPASKVALEGSTLNGMAFSLYGGRATWDCAGILNQMTTTNTVPAGPTIQISSFASVGGQPVLTWSSTPGATYQVFFKNSLTDPSWTSAGSVPATGTTVNWTDTTSSGNQRYYKVEETSGS
jgi:hypothetical protein